jgi:cytidylate kinase
MINESFYVITISHQFGSGGALLGQKISERLGIPLVDQQILKWVSEQLNLTEVELEKRQERISSFWLSFFRTTALIDPVIGISSEQYYPTDKELFDLESEFILQIAKQNSAIFLGRCGRYILRDHPRHLSIFVHADLSERIKRISELYQLSKEEAKKYIEKTDSDRNAYISTFTKQNWLDPRLYDLCVNTGTIELDQIVELVNNYMQSKTNN